MGKLSEASRFCCGAASDQQPIVSAERLVEQGGYPGGQSATGDLKLRGSDRIRGSGAGDGGELRQPQCLRDHALAGVLAHGIIGDELRRGLVSRRASAVGRPVGLGVENLIVVIEVGQQSGAGNGAIQCRHALRGYRCSEVRLIAAGPGNCRL